jgi:hypothetical protein
MDIDQLPKWKKRVDLDLKIDDDTVLKQSLGNPYLYHQYLDVYLSEMRELKRLHVEKDRIFQTLYSKYKFNHSQNLDTKAEIEMWVKADPQWLTIITQYNEQDIVVKYFESVVEAISKMNFSINSYISFKKFLSGQ